MSNDTKITKYRKQINEKTKALGEKPKKVFRTNGILNINTTSTNLNLLNTKSKCLDCLTVLAQLELAYEKVCTWVPNPGPLTLENYPLDEYIADVKLCFAIADWEEKKQELDNMYTQLTQLLSNEGKAAETIADIAKKLKLD